MTSKCCPYLQSAIILRVYFKVYISLNLRKFLKHVRFHLKLSCQYLLKSPTYTKTENVAIITLAIFSIFKNEEKLAPHQCFSQFFSLFDSMNKDKPFKKNFRILPKISLGCTPKIIYNPILKKPYIDYLIALIQLFKSKYRLNF